jgi:hypothetical protein
MGHRPGWHPERLPPPLIDVERGRVNDETTAGTPPVPPMFCFNPNDVTGELKEIGEMLLLRIKGLAEIGNPYELERLVSAYVQLENRRRR